MKNVLAWLGATAAKGIILLAALIVAGVIAAAIGDAVMWGIPRLADWWRQ